MAKRIRAVIRLQIAAGKATPAPPVGSVLGQYGINIMAFVKEYNERTASQVGTVLPAEVTIFEDRSFTFNLRMPPTSTLLKSAAGLAKGSTKAHRDSVGRISGEQLREIAALKMPDLNATSLEGAMRMVEGTARSMGIEIGEPS